MKELSLRYFWRSVKMEKTRKVYKIVFQEIVLGSAKQNAV